MFRVWWGIYISLCYKFPTESNSERILKIGKYLVKLWARVRCLVFLTHSVQEAQLSPRYRAMRCVSWNRVNCCTNVRRISSEKPCNRRMTFKVIRNGTNRYYGILTRMMVVLMTINLSIRSKDMTGTSKCRNGSHTGVKLGGRSHQISDPAPLVTDPVPHNWNPAPFCWDPPLCAVYIWVFFTMHDVL